MGCDPDNQTAMLRLLAIKQRPVEKGVILIAASYAQLRPYVDETQLTADQLTQVLASWPAPLTWVMPASGDTPSWFVVSLIPLPCVFRIIRLFRSYVSPLGSH